MTCSARALATALLATTLASPALAVVYEVNNTNLACSDAGAGTLASPFCTIGRGAAVAVAGDTVNVAAGDYREQVVLPASGTAGFPITFHGAAGARVIGTDRVTGFTLEPGSTTKYSASFDPATASAQVFVNGVRLTGPVASAADVVANSFFFDNPANRLYVDLAGADPNTATIEAGARSFGFLAEGRSDVVIEGFEVSGHNTNAIRVQNGSRAIVRNNRLLRSASFVLAVQGTTTPTTIDNVTVSGNEIAEGLITGLRLRNNVSQALVQSNRVHHNGDHGLDASNTTNSRFTGNRFYANVKPGGGFATGMRLGTESDDNLVDRNVAYENQDTGFQVSGLSDRTLFVRNLSYQNLDHGFDIRQCDGARVVSNTAANNTNDGFSIEDNVTNTYLRNNIAAENGIFTGGNELWVDATSAVGFSSDYDVFFRSSAPNTTIEFNGVAYSSLALFAAATGNEAHGSGANPAFTNPAADNYHPGAGPALDAADASASGFELLDLDNLPPLDLPGIVDTGAGVPSYADRGALEAVDAAPVARVRLRPRNPRVGRPMTADASASTDDFGIVSYRFVWGDGTSQTQATPIATHTYTTAGDKTFRLTVTDALGHSHTRIVSVRVR